VNEGDSGLYVVTVTDRHTCTGVYDVHVNVRPRPYINLSDYSDTNFCEASNIELVANTDAVRLDWYGPSFKKLNSSSLNLTIPNAQVMNQGLYKVVAHNSYGCQDSSSITIYVHKLPKADFVWSSRCNNAMTMDSVWFNSTSVGASKYQWYLDNLQVGDSIRTRQVFATSGTYAMKLVVTNAKGCTDEIEKGVFVQDAPQLHLPNAFTPNNDFLNTFYKPVATASVRNYHMMIFDRWGQLQYEWKGPYVNDMTTGAWDGKINGQFAPVGVYAVLVKYNTDCSYDMTVLEKEMKTNITLLR
jgi:gliding motility-associated-like protein